MLKSVKISRICAINMGDMAKQYYVAHAHTVTDLEKIVNAKLAEGWELQGGISGMRIHDEKARLDVEFGHDAYTYVQAMVKN